MDLQIRENLENNSPDFFGYFFNFLGFPDPFLKSRLYPGFSGFPGKVASLKVNEEKNLDVLRLKQIMSKLLILSQFLL